jgi:hypothetical protein
LPVRLQLDVPDGGRQPLAERHRTRPLGQALLPVLDRLGVWSDALAQRSCPSASTSISQAYQPRTAAWPSRRSAAGVELDGGVIGTLDIHAGQPRDWDPSEVSALHGASLADRAGQGGADGRERLDAQTASSGCGGAARSSTRRLADVARDVTVGQPLPTNRRELARAVPSQAKDRQTGT